MRLNIAVAEVAGCFKILCLATVFFGLFGFGVALAILLVSATGRLYHIIVDEEMVMMYIPQYMRKLVSGSSRLTAFLHRFELCRHRGRGVANLDRKGAKPITAVHQPIHCGNSWCDIPVFCGARVGRDRRRVLDHDTRCIHVFSISLTESLWRGVP